MNFNQKVNSAIGQALADLIEQEQDGITNLILKQEEQVANAANARLEIYFQENPSYRIAERTTMPTREMLTKILRDTPSKHSDYQDKIEAAKTAIDELRRIEEEYKKEGKLPDSIYKK